VNDLGHSRDTSRMRRAAMSAPSVRADSRTADRTVQRAAPSRAAHDPHEASHSRGDRSRGRQRPDGQAREARPLSSMKFV
jgi:hypothetical protein